MNKLFKRFGEMCDLSILLMFLGAKMAFCVLAVGIAAYKYNEIFVNGYGNRMFSFQIVQTAWNLLVIFILGALALDCTIRR